jgi:hypothetical protein
MTSAPPPDRSRDPDEAAICARILNDTILSLARRFGVKQVVHALTEITGCQECLNGASARPLFGEADQKTD